MSDSIIYDSNFIQFLGKLSTFSISAFSIRTFAHFKSMGPLKLANFAFRF